MLQLYSPVPVYKNTQKNIVRMREGFTLTETIRAGHTETIRAGHLAPMATIKYSLSSPSSNVDYIHIIIIIFASLRV